MPRDSMLEQRMRNLKAADRVRLARAKTKREIRAGELRADEALGLGCMRTCSVWDLLEAQPRWGETRTERALWRIGEILWGPGGPVFDGWKRVGECCAREVEAVERVVVEFAVGARGG